MKLKIVSTQLEKCVQLRNPGLVQSRKRPSARFLMHKRNVKNDLRLPPKKDAYLFTDATNEELLSHIEGGFNLVITTLSRDNNNAF